jgi:sucrose-6-phosphate hydrolase SacC (GH32 family)
MLLAAQLFMTAASTATAMDPRPIFHLTYDSNSSGQFRLPPLFVNSSRSFMNDPNGLLFFAGRYHVFAQWGMGGHSGASWLHAVSSDLAHWQMLPPAIVAGAGNESLSGEWDAGGVYSGHAMVLEGRPVLVYCALDGRLGKARRTVAWAEAEDPKDPQLLRWRKLRNQPWVNASLGQPPFVDVFCDPLTWRSGGHSGAQMVGAIVYVTRPEP